jgi:hypothetical protein
LALVAEAGGYAGLFLGASFYQIVQFLAHLVDLKLMKMNSKK